MNPICRSALVLLALCLPLSALADACGASATSFSSNAPSGTASAAEGFALQPVSLLPPSHDARYALDRVLRRQQLEGCLASLLSPPAESASVVAASADGYVPKTPFDNTPHRFDMQQGGKRMTAADFDAWMQARGYRVSKGKAAAQAAETASQ